MALSDKKDVYDWIIIGAGAAGLFAGAHLTSGRHLILESGRRAGLKLLMAGGGMCNFTHAGPIYRFTEHYGRQKVFVKPALKAFDNEYVMEFFRKHGVDSFADERGKVFPESRQASSLLAVLLERIEKNGVRMVSNGKVTELAQEEGLFKVITENTFYRAKNVLVTTGGKSYPTTGSDGNGYLLAKQMGHRIEHPHVALAPVLAQEKVLMELAGTAFDSVEIELLRQGKKIGSYQGEMLITHDGLSGPVILDHSRDMSPQDIVRINLTKESMTASEVEKRIVEMSAMNGKLQVKSLVRELLHSKRIAEHVQKVAGIPEARILSELSKAERKSLVMLSVSYPVEIKCLGGFEIAMATAGGVAVDEIDAKTMMSKKVKGLYFAGEVLDIDGDSGGYNIQWAFSSGALAVVKKQ